MRASTSPSQSTARAYPKCWIPEAARLLRQSGQLVFLTNSFLLMLCILAEDGIAAADQLLRPAFGMYRVEWPGDSGVEFHLSHGDWVDCCGARASTLRIWSRCAPPRTRTHATRSSRWSGRGSGPAKKYGRRANADDRASVAV